MSSSKRTGAITGLQGSEYEQTCDSGPADQITIADDNSTQNGGGAALAAGLYLITSDIDVAFLTGTNPTVTAATGHKLWSKTYRWLKLTTAQKVAAIVITSGDTGTVSIELIKAS